MAFNRFTSLIRSSWKPRVIETPAAPEQPRFGHEDEATKALKKQIKNMQDEYNKRLAEVGSSPQRADSPDHTSYASRYNDWAAQKQRLDVGFDRERQRALDAHNELLRQAGRQAGADGNDQARRQARRQTIIVPPWKRAAGTLPEPEPPTLADTLAVAAATDVPGRIRSFIAKVSRNPADRFRTPGGGGRRQ